MADIDLPIEYSAEVKDFVKLMMNDPAFTFKNWSDDELTVFRKAVRDFYREAQGGLCAFCKQSISIASVGNLLTLTEN